MKTIYWILLVLTILVSIFVIRLRTAAADVVIEQIVINHPSTPQEFIARMFPNAPVMMRIARAESGFDPLADNPTSTAKGIYQILDGTWAGEKCEGDVLDWRANIRCAKKLYTRYGTTPWNASKYNWQ